MTTLIYKATLNQLALTLSELESVSLDVNWLFRFVKDQGKQEYFCYLEDLNVSTARYNLFHLLEGTDVTFEYLGDYLYEVYQMPDGGSTDYSLGNRCEIGKIKVLDEVVVTPSFTPNLINKIYDQQ